MVDWQLAQTSEMDLITLEGFFDRLETIKIDHQY